MAEIKDKMAFFTQVVKNMNKNEYRQNDNSAKYILPAGLVIDAGQTEDDGIDRELITNGPQAWLAMIEDTTLHTALSSLKPLQLELLYLYMVMGYSQNDLARHFGVTQPSINSRYNRILARLKKFF